MIIFTISFIFLFAAFLFYRHKTKIAVVEEPNKNYKQLLEQQVVYYQKLTDTNKKRFEAMVQVFLESVHIEGVGTEIADSDRVLIASSAVIPVFGFPGWEYKNLTNVILYPD